MSRWSGPRRYGGPWYGNDAQRVLFERGVRQNFAAMQGTTHKSGDNSGRVYKVTVDVPNYEPRRVEILFPKKSPKYVKITVDGPTDSPHRYREHQLCIWHPDDPTKNRWVFEDGLLHLLGLILAHLFREAWWRETGEWLGPEVGHISPELPADLGGPPQ